VVGVLSVAVAMAVTACGGEPDRAPAGRPAGPPAVFGAGVPVASVPAVPSDSDPRREVLPAVLVGGTAYLPGSDVVRVIDTRTAAEIATIRPQLPPRWTSIGQPVAGAPLHAAIGGVDSVVWPFLVRTPDGVTGVQLIRIDARTHAATPVLLAGLPEWVGGAAGNASVAPIGAQGDTVVLTLTAGLSQAVAAVDAVHGKTLWSRDNVTGAAVTGSTVVDVEADPAPAAAGAQRVVGLGLADGRPRWLGPRGYGPQLYPTGPNLIGVSAQLPGPLDNPERGIFELLSVTDGAVVSRLPLPGDTPARCLYDQVAVAVCEAPTGLKQGGRVVIAFDARTGRQLWTLPDRNTGSEDTPLITAAWHGLFYGATAQGTTVTYQARDGEPTAESAGSPPLVVNDQAALSLDPSHTQILARRPAPRPTA
jgi:hypothetical protein